MGKGGSDLRGKGAVTIGERSSDQRGMGSDQNGMGSDQRVRGQ